jgi:hypothetical protein
MIGLILLAWLAVGHSVTLNWSWTPNSVKATKFSVQRGSNPAGPFHQIATVPLTQFSYVDTTVIVRQKPYCYEVIALSKIHNSPASNVACGKIP